MNNDLDSMLEALLRRSSRSENLDNIEQRVRSVLDARSRSATGLWVEGVSTEPRSPTLHFASLALALGIGFAASLAIPLNTASEPGLPYSKSMLFVTSPENLPSGRIDLAFLAMR